MGGEGADDMPGAGQWGDNDGGWTGRPLSGEILTLAGVASRAAAGSQASLLGSASHVTSCGTCKGDYV